MMDYGSIVPRHLLSDIESLLDIHLPKTKQFQLVQLMIRQSGWLYHYEPLILFMTGRMTITTIIMEVLHSLLHLSTYELI